MPDIAVRKKDGVPMVTNRTRSGPDESGRGRTPRQLRAAAAALVDRVNRRGMTLTVEVAETILREQQYADSVELGSNRRPGRPYPDEDALDELADQLVAGFADEEPGADLFSLARTARMNVASFGRLIAGLAESIQFFGSYTGIDDTDRRARIHETAQLLSLAGMMQADHTSGHITAPPAMFARIARTLTSVAELADNADLAATLRRDAMRARAGSRP